MKIIVKMLLSLKCVVVVVVRSLVDVLAVEDVQRAVIGINS